jgi:hypothetical protein
MSHLLWNPRVHYSVHRSPAHVPILSHMNPILTLTCMTKLLIIRKFNSMEHNPYSETNKLVSRLIKNCPTVYWTVWFITMFTRARHGSLSSVTWIQSSHSPIWLQITTISKLNSFEQCSSRTSESRAASHRLACLHGTARGIAMFTRSRHWSLATWY